ncbi:unnamed protein product [Tuber aestivum]|uniref:WSC domain-containing protein n=1 Tax=Tuber aestivum TaxID=59557 RepID=A0A292Q4T8_9PEZI|nr:unnamed protein product [Tuber aestivum]
MKTLILATILLPLLTSVAAQSSAGPAGCYRGPGSLSSQQLGAPNSVAACRETCVRAGNYRVQAMTGGTECYCGDNLPQGPRAPDSNCGANCAGALNETCGSNDGMFFSFYFTGASASPPAGSNTTSGGGGNSNTTRSGGAQTSVPANTTAGRGGATTSEGSAATRTGGPAGTTGSSATGTAASTSTGASSGDSVQVGSGVLIGAVIGILAMVF